MCGFIGFSSENSQFDMAVADKMLSSIAHRGPDSQNIEQFRVGSRVGFLGHARLSILDLSDSGIQPMRYEHYSLVFNGEIYNYQELRNRLLREGYSFDSRSDTEVILKGFHCWGEKLFSELRGMFAFAIVDLSSKRILFVRDRLGVKPLYWGVVDGSLIFASELKALLSVEQIQWRVDSSAVSSFLRRGWNSTSQSFIEGVRQVEPGSSVTIHLDTPGESESRRYWSPLPVKPFSGDYLDAVHSKLEESVRYRLISDVEVGCFLSGGIDSSVVAAVANRLHPSNLKTYSVRFEDPAFDEGDRARYISKLIGTTHKEFFFTDADVKKVIPDLINATDDPFNDWSTLPMLMLSRYVSDELKVVLSGDGGDEFFFGYEKYFYAMELMARPPAEKVLAKMSELCNRYAWKTGANRIIPGILASLDYRANVSKNNDVVSILDAMSHHLGPNVARTVLSEYAVNLANPWTTDGLSNLSADIQLRLSDIRNYLCFNILPKLDRSTMAHGLEAREPLLDHELLELALSGNARYTKLCPPGKSVLRDILKKEVPDYPFDSQKKGFSVPMGRWIRGSLREQIMDTIGSRALDVDEHLEVKACREYVERYVVKGVGNPKFVWTLFLYASWKDRWSFV